MYLNYLNVWWPTLNHNLKFWGKSKMTSGFVEACGKQARRSMVSINTLLNCCFKFSLIQPNNICKVVSRTRINQDMLYSLAICGFPVVLSNSWLRYRGYISIFWHVKAFRISLHVYIIDLISKLHFCLIQNEDGEGVFFNHCCQSGASNLPKICIIRFLVHIISHLKLNFYVKNY